MRAPRPRANGGRVRAAVVGAGLMGRWHALELRRAGGALSAVVDSNPAAAAALARRHSTLAHEDLDQLLERDPPEVVHVCTPTRSHVDIARRALDAGAHVLVEKPLAPDSASTETLLDLARRVDRLLCPVHQYLFQPGVMRAQAAISRLGSLVQLEALACSAGGGTAQGPELDAVALEIAPHALAVMERLLPIGLTGVTWATERPKAGELRGHGRAGDVGVSLTISLHGRPPRNELRAICEAGTLELDFFHGYAWLERGPSSRTYKALRPFVTSARHAGAAAANLSRRAVRGEPAYPGLRGLIESFYSAAREGSAAPISPEETLAVAAARDQLASSSAHHAVRAGSARAQR
jgi:predicted dehydrogenase